MHTYPNTNRSFRRSVRRQPRTTPPCLAHSGHATVVTMLEPSVRGIIDGATDGSFSKIHVDSVGDAVRAVREHSASALLLSPSVATWHPLSDIQALLVKSPGVTAIAVLADNCPTVHDALLDLGACGVRQVVNLAEREGWNRLRELVDQTGGDAGQLIAREILSALEGASDDARRFFATVVRIAPETSTVRQLAKVFTIEPSTLMSRFFRASLPAPKTYLAMMRLLYAAHFLEIPKVSVAATANALHYSSPQSFGRHVRNTLGLTAGQFRHQMPMRAALDHFRTRLIEPYCDILNTFRPLRG